MEMDRNCPLKGRCVYCITLDQDIFLRLFPGYRLMGSSKKQGNKTGQLRSGAVILHMLRADDGLTVVARHR